jgi:hypothetical protein
MAVSKRALDVDPLRFMRQSIRTELDVAEAFKSIEQWANRQPAIGLWQEPTLDSPWANFDAVNFEDARYRLEGDMVRIEGLVKTTANVAAVNSRIFTLPEGYRPPLFIVRYTGGYASTTGQQHMARLSIDAGGQVLFEQFAPTPAGGFPYTVNYLSIALTFSMTPTPKK